VKPTDADLRRIAREILGPRPPETEQTIVRPESALVGPDLKPFPRSGPFGLMVSAVANRIAYSSPMTYADILAAEDRLAARTVPMFRLNTDTADEEERRRQTVEERYRKRERRHPLEQLVRHVLAGDVPITWVIQHVPDDAAMERAWKRATFKARWVLTEFVRPRVYANVRKWAVRIVGSDAYECDKHRLATIEWIMKRHIGPPTLGECIEAARKRRGRPQPFAIHVT
jgi:hypothetical protein